MSEIIHACHGEQAIRTYNTSSIHQYIYRLFLLEYAFQSRLNWIGITQINIDNTNNNTKSIEDILKSLDDNIIDTNNKDNDDF